MYKQIPTSETFTTINGNENFAVATLADEYGGVCQIGIDDGCYILYQLNHTTGQFNKVYHWFREATEVLKKLPSNPRIHNDKILVITTCQRRKKRFDKIIRNLFNKG